ncbi:glycosyltransferase family 2 protein [Campylobacter upsaliensis]|uniref:Putative sugar transferase n=1 Tax=Campylobacter upsaliensis TaxID=28080 RepID=A0A3S4TGP1_CAMUP|nr:glycosyltransferase family 2 protein [Campylobacter upsaliensis]MCA5589208.1 glycosyltransferase [Campylobacter upsaliensis]VEG85458.1 putative sugar transferase [Campylobacter upsaliensis]
MLISILIPSYNSASYIKECLESVLAQSYAKLEILCIDAYSNDGTLDILEEFAKKDERIKLILSEKKSFGYQLNLGLKKATGEYFSIVESDDLAHPLMCERLLNLALTTKCDIVKANLTSFTQDKQEFLKIISNENFYGRILDEKDRKDVLKEGFIINVSALYSLDLIKKFDLKLNETSGAAYQDTGFWFELFSVAKTWYFHNESLYFYRQDNPNASTKSKEKIYAICEEFAFIDSFLKRQNLEHLREVFLYRKFKSYWWNLRRIDQKYRAEFLVRFAKDFQNESLKIGIFSTSELKELQTIIANPQQFAKKLSNPLFSLKKFFARFKKSLL